jgi:selenocysteine lyase/cysteine desulfurase
MGTTRNGARSFLNLIAKACKMSRLPGFRSGLAVILGPDEYSSLVSVWEPFCAVVDILIATDNWYNQIDYTVDVVGGEDIPG